jgi:hypothetical protein
MSFIFHSEVDQNLQVELNYRGNAGKNRSTADIDFMVGKIANVQLTAYQSGSADPTQIAESYGILGGAQLRSGRYLPTGPDGYLNDAKYDTVNLARDSNGDLDFDVNGKAYLKTTTKSDQSRRIGPVITGVDVKTSDQAMSFFNNATIQITIPNPERDLDGMEETWFRPGRFVKLDIVHPDSAILSRDAAGNAGLLKKTSIPTREKLQTLYPTWDLDKLEKEIRKMNEYSFQGLITTFDFSYQPNGTVEASIQLRGVSNVYTDITMLMSNDTKKTPDAPPTNNEETLNVTILNTNTNAAAGQQNLNSATTQQSSFYSRLHDIVDGLVVPAQIAEPTGIIRYQTPKKARSNVTDQYILYGEPFLPYSTDINGTTKAGPNPVTKFNRYITLGALIQFINDYLVSIKVSGTAANAQIICDDQFTCSNYYPHLVSCIPDEILLLPKETNKPDGMNSYTPAEQITDQPGLNQLIYYKDISTNTNRFGILDEWPGVATTAQAIDSNKIFASRIFINLITIQNILNGKSIKYTLKEFLIDISAKIAYATGNAINLIQNTYPLDETKILYIDKFYQKTALTGVTDRPTVVTPYSVPMLANHENGTIVRDFKMSATLPGDAKDLMYVLNNPTAGITEAKLAPYLNLMYNSNNVDKINQILQQYKDDHTKFVAELRVTKFSFAQAPTVPEKSQALYKALTSYVNYPTADLRKSQQMTAPIFSFDVEFTIDGINGFRNGDTLTFDALPLKYRINTVFAIISINHTVTSDGQWQTIIRCVMKPSIN